jgi:hypothetical protein
MHIIKALVVFVILNMISIDSDTSSTYMCDEPTDRAISLVNSFVEEESFSEDRSDLGLEDVSPEDIQPLAAVSGGGAICDTLSTKYSNFLHSESDVYSYASYFIVQDKYVAVFTPRLPDDVSDEEVMVTGLSILYILDDEFNQIIGFGG